jgi:hypothetical protein
MHLSAAERRRLELCVSRYEDRLRTGKKARTLKEEHVNEN